MSINKKLIQKLVMKQRFHSNKFQFFLLNLLNIIKVKTDY